MKKINKTFLLVFSIIVSIVFLTGYLYNTKNNIKTTVNFIKKSKYIDVIPQDAMKIIKKNQDIKILDVSPAYNEVHISNAINIREGGKVISDYINLFDKSDVYLVYCHFDSNSIRAAEILINNGFENVYRLKGNIQAWIDSGYDVVYGDFVDNIENSYKDISPQNAKNMIENDSNVVILDVSPGYNKVHIPGAINYQIPNGELIINIDDLDKSKKYLVYCHFDKQSTKGARILTNNGFENVYRLKGNIQAWIDSGYDVVYGD